MTINCKGNLINLEHPKVMGILNSTPDSFFDGGKYRSPKAILAQVDKMLQQGATFIDVGAYSSRPGAEHVSEALELSRLVPIVQLLLKEYPDILLSIDTFRSNVAHECLQLGAALINDISAGNMDEKMLQVIAHHQVPYIMMHMKGTPQNMQQQSSYSHLMEEILYYFSEKISLARALHINDIVIDPGFGFAKTIRQNYALLRAMELLQTLNLPLLAGLSRKSMIYKTLDTTAENALNGTTALNMVALQKGSCILRVHDVREAMECIALFEALK